MSRYIEIARESGLAHLAPQKCGSPSEVRVLQNTTIAPIPAGHVSPLHKLPPKVAYNDHAGRLRNISARIELNETRLATARSSPSHGATSKGLLRQIERRLYQARLEHAELCAVP